MWKESLHFSDVRNWKRGSGIGDVSNFDVAGEKANWQSFYQELEGDSTSGSGESFFDSLKNFLNLPFL